MAPLISIFIPAYNRVRYLERLLESIKKQEFKDFNVIVTDDSDNDLVKNLAKKYEASFEIKYYRNIPSLGTPENWNQGIRMSDGQWLKIMHDDDYFTTNNALDKLAKATKESCEFIFCAYNTDNEKTNEIKKIIINSRQVAELQKNPYLLFYNNIVGPPSTVMVKRNIENLYDSNLKWVVDFDYYIRVINHTKIYYIPDCLINMTYNDTQVTNSCFRNKEIEIPEALILYEKYGSKLVANLFQFNSWWRFIRNLEIKDNSDFIYHSKGHKIPDFIFGIIKFQSAFPRKLLITGFISRPLMMLYYITRFKADKN